MNAPTIKQIDTRISSATQAFDAEIEKIAMEVFDTLVVPLCQKYKLRFIVSVDLWYFLETDGQEREICTKGYGLNVNPVVWHGNKLDELENVREVLSLIVDGSTLGNWMPNFEGE